MSHPTVWGGRLPSVTMIGWMRNRIGERIGAWVATAHLADGAMSSVYEARHFQTRALVAIKVLGHGAARDPVARERFVREYETAKSLRDPHIVEVIDFGETADGAPFIAMELLEGETLASLLRREGPICPARTVRIICQLALALRHAHSEGVIHRDLKPGNVFVCEMSGEEHIRVLDFGSVKLQLSIGPKLTAFGTTLGSPCYMSPEQALGRLDVDPRSDVFSLAAILYEVATGEMAFAGGTVGEVLAKIIETEPTALSDLNPDYPWRLDDVVRRGLRKDKSVRFASAIELAEAMLRALGLPAEVERWAHGPLDDIERLLPLSRFSAEPPGGPPGLRRAAAGERGLGRPTTIPPK